MRRLRILILGALNGVLYSTVMLLMVWQIRAYEDARNVSEAARLGRFPVQLTGNERWAPIVATWILIFTVTAWVVSYFWRRDRRGSLWFWTTVGLIAVSAWNVLTLSAFWIEMQFSAQRMSYEWVTSSSNPIFGPISLGVVVLVSLLYGLLMRLFEKRPVTN